MISIMKMKIVMLICKEVILKDIVLLVILLKIEVGQDIVLGPRVLYTI